MDTKFNLYDLFGYLIPGAILMLGFAAIGVVLGVVQRFDPSWATAILGIPLAYALGHLVHQLGRTFFPSEGRCQRNTYSIRVLLKDSPDLTPSFKSALRSVLVNKFHLSATGEVSAPEQQRWWHRSSRQCSKQCDNCAAVQTYWTLCYDYVSQNSKGAYTENFSAIMGFYRNTLVVVIILNVAAVLAVLTCIPLSHFADLGAQIARSIRSGEISRLAPAFLCVGIAGIDGLVIALLHKGYKQFTKRFAVSVYRTFYVALTLPSDGEKANAHK